jgi:hypothetical protein
MYKRFLPGHDDLIVTHFSSECIGGLENTGIETGELV